MRNSKGSSPVRELAAAVFLTIEAVLLRQLDAPFVALALLEIGAEIFNSVLFGESRADGV